MVHNDVEAFEGAPGNTLHPFVNAKLKDDFMGTTNELEDTDNSSNQSENNETLIGTKGEPVENVDPPVAGNESVPEDGKVILDKHEMCG